MATIEQASAADVPAIDRLARVLYADEARPYTPVRQGSRTFVARRGGEVVGFAVCTFSHYGINRSGQIDELAVSEAAQREGVGRDLLGACEAWLKSEGIEVIFVSVMAGAETFYTRLGFRPCIGPWFFLALIGPQSARTAEPTRA